MSEDLENYTHMKKSKYTDNARNINLVENKSTKQKLFFEADKLKNDSKESDNISNNNSTKKVSVNTSKNIYCKKRANSFYDTEKPIVHYNNDIKISKKLIINKSYNNNDRKNSYNKPNNNINNKVMKKPINNSRNQKIIYNNSPSNKYGNKIKLRKKIIYNLKSNDSKSKTCINDIDISQINEKHNKTYFNTLFNNDGSSNKSNEKHYFSCSQNMENKDSNNLKKVNIINIDLSSNHNEDIKSKFIIEAGKEFDFNNSNKNFYIKKSKNPFHPKNRFINLNNDYSNNTKYEEIIKNHETHCEDSNSIMNKSQKKFQQPIKIYNDNTTINLADTYNFNQYLKNPLTNEVIEKCYEGDETFEKKFGYNSFIINECIASLISLYLCGNESVQEIFYINKIDSKSVTQTIWLLFFAQVISNLNLYNEKEKVWTHSQSQASWIILNYIISEQKESEEIIKIELDEEKKEFTLNINKELLSDSINDIITKLVQKFYIYKCIGDVENAVKLIEKYSVIDNEVVLNVKKLVENDEENQMLYLYHNLCMENDKVIYKEYKADVEDIIRSNLDRFGEEFNKDIYNQWVKYATNFLKSK